MRTIFDQRGLKAIGGPRVAAGVVAVLLTAGVAACSSSGASDPNGATASATSSAAGGATQTIRIAVLPTQSNLGIYTAMDKGYFAAAGGTPRSFCTACSALLLARSTGP